MSYKLHNQGKRTIQFGKDPEEIIKPGAVAIVSDEIGVRLLNLYAGEVVDLDNLKVSYNEKDSKDFTASKKKTGGRKKAAAVEEVEADEEESDEKDE